MKRSRTTVLLILLMAVSGCEQPKDSDAEATGDASTARYVTVRVEPVARARIHVPLRFSGTLLPIRATTIVPDVEGIIESFPLSDRAVEYVEDGKRQSRYLGLDMGHHVKQGDVLVKLRDSDFRLAWEMAKANYEVAKRELENLLAWRRPEEVRQLEAQLAQANATWERAKADLKRSTELHEQGVMTDGEHDLAVMTEKTAQAVQMQAAAALELAQAGPTPEEIEVAKAKIAAAELEIDIRKDSLDKTVIVAPYDAVIADRYVDVGDRVQPMPRTDIMQLIDPTVLFAEIGVPEQYQGRVTLYDPAHPERETDRVWVYADNLDNPVPGRIDLINSKIDSETRTFRVRVTIDNQDGRLRPGGFVRVVVPVASASDVLIVPSGAVTVLEGVHAVFVHDPSTSRVARREVTVGLTGETRTEIRTGVAEGEQVVVSNTALLADGLTVRLEEPTTLPVSIDAPPTQEASL